MEQVYWGDEFQLQRTVPPLAYKAEEKTKHPNPITSKDLIGYYLSTLGATSYGEIYNLHAVIVDRNVENHPQPTCQKLAIKLAEMFASASLFSMNLFVLQLTLFSSRFGENRLYN